MNQSSAAGPIEAKLSAPGTIGSRVQKYGLAAILISFTILGFLYDVSVPLFEKPDELKHFALIQFIQTQRRLPLVRAGVYQPWDQEGTQPPLYHMIAALMTAWLDLSHFEEPPRNPHYVDDRSFIWRERGNNNLYLHSPDEMFSLAPATLAARLARGLSLLAGLATIILTYRLGRVVFGERPGITTADPFDKLPTIAGLRRAGRRPLTAEKVDMLANISPVDDDSQQEMGKSENQGFTISNQLPAEMVRSLPLLAAALVAFIPQFLHVSSAITNDGLSVTFAAAALLLLALMLKYGLSTPYAFYLGLVLGLGAITKLSLLYLWLPVGLVFIIDFIQRRSLGRLLRFGAITAALAMLVAGWWYWRNWQVYGDPSALNAHLLYRGGPLDPRPSLAQLWQTEMVGLELSFWAAFGAGQILLEPWLYTLLRGIKYLFFLGLILGLWQTIRSLKLARRNLFKFIIHHSLFIILLLWPLIIFIALLRWMQITPASWGRLLYPALPSLAILAAWSLTHLAHFAANGKFRNFWIKLTLHTRKQNLPANPPTQAIPRTRAEPPCGTHYELRITHYALRFTFYLPWLLPLFLLTLSIITPFRYLQAAYAKTPLVAKADIPAEGVQRLDYFYGSERLRLIGYRVEKSEIRPGDWLPVTLYWQAGQPVAKNYSVFVHLLDDTGNAIGQANTYPDGGNWPTSLLPPGPVLADTYYVPVPPEADAPQMTRLAFGLFEFEDPARAAKPAANSAGQAVEPIVAGPPLIPHQWPLLDPARPLAANFGGQIKLIGYNPINEKIRLGTQVPITFYWETLAAPGRPLNLFIHLVDPANQTQVAGFDGPPRYPTQLWQPGNTLIDTRSLALPPDLPPGEYDLHIGWYNPDNFGRLPLTGEGVTGDSLRLFTVTVVLAESEQK